MKNTRKILIMLLSIALLVAAFSLTAFAAGEETLTEEEINLAKYEAALADCSKVLEFYEAGTYFELRVDESGNVVKNGSEEGAFLKGGAYSESVVDNALTFTSVNPTKVNLSQNSPSSFGLNLRAKLTEGAPLSLCVVSSDTGDYLSLFTVSVGSVTHQFDPSVLQYKKEDVAITADEFFDLAVYVEKTAGMDNVYISLVTDGGVEWSTTYSYANDSTDFLAGKFSYDAAYLSATASTFKYVEMYPGTFQRYVDNTKNVDIIAEGLVKAYNTYLEYKDLRGVNGAFELAEIVARIAVLYGYPVDSVSNSEAMATIKGAFDDCTKTVSAAYAAEINANNALITSADNDSKDYNDRLDTYRATIENKDYITLLQTGDYAANSGVNFEEMATAFENADAEYAKLLEIEKDTIAVIEATSKIASIYIATYEELKVAYEAIKDIDICATYSSDVYSESVVVEAAQKRNVVISNYPIVDAKAATFVENVAIAADTANVFSVRYAAYVVAKENVFTDATYDKYLVDTTVAEINNVFAAIDTEMRAVSDVCEAFLSKIRVAALTPSYTVKIQALDEAKPYLTIVEKGYPEVEDAIASYYAMRDDITARKEAARRYIQAVINVQIASTVKEKMVAIEIAEAFAVLGNESSVDIEGMKMTVTEANIVLSNEKSAINLKATRISNFVAMANSIATKATVAERRQAIYTAMAMKEDLVDDADEEDVILANEILDKAIKAYNADVNTANTQANESETASLNLLAKTVPAKRIAEIIAIVKKFYE